MDGHLEAYQGGFEGALDNGSSLLATSCQTLLQANETSKSTPLFINEQLLTSPLFRSIAPFVHL